MTCRVKQGLASRGWTLVASHVMGTMNVLADALFKAVSISSEGSPIRESFLWACVRISYPPRRDFHVTSENLQLPTLVAPHRAREDKIRLPSCGLNPVEVSVEVLPFSTGFSGFEEAEDVRRKAVRILPG